MVKVPVFRPPYGGFPNVNKGKGPEAAVAFRCGARSMKSTGRRSTHLAVACPAAR